MAVLTMAVTYRKQMNPLRLANIWGKSKTILVYFVRVAGLKSTRSCKSELSYDIELLAQITMLLIL